MNKFTSSIPKMFLVLAFLFQALPSATAGDESPQPAPITSADPDIPIGELELLLRPLTKDQLLLEAAVWQASLQESAEEIAKAEIAVKRQNTEIEKAKKIQKAAKETQDKLETAKDMLAQAKESGDTEAMEAAQKSTKEAQEGMKKVSEAVTEAAKAAEKTTEVKKEISEQTKQELTEAEGAADKAQKALDKVQQAVASQGGSEQEIREDLKDAAKAAQEASDDTDLVEKKVQESIDAMDVASSTATGMDDVQVAKRDEKVELLEKITELREERTIIIDQFNTVLNALEKKTNPDDSETLSKIQEYRGYIAAVGGIDLNIEDVTSTWIAIKGWLLSSEGGGRVARNFGSFIGILLAAWILSRVIGALFHRFISSLGKLSKLLEDFLVKAIRWIIMAIGIVWALSALEVSIGPLVAVIGAAGFVVAFALQDSLGNFASGLMILGFKPYDIGDIVEAGGVSGQVTSMNLVSTSIKTFDNKQMVVPNNKVWHDVITNATAATTRRVDLEFGVGYTDDVDLAQSILAEIVNDHPLTLAEPAPVIKVHSLGDSSVNIICRPWVNTSDYWTVYWDMTDTAKKRFDDAGISIPFPQRDVHLYTHTPQPSQESE